MNTYLSSSIHTINADKKIGPLKKFIWLITNIINNYLFPNFSSGFEIRNFCPEVNENDFSRLDLKSSLLRILCDLFWLKINWRDIKRELGDINILDIGCGSGQYGIKLQQFSDGLISSYYGIDNAFSANWEKVQEKHTYIKFRECNSDNFFKFIPENTNLFITQSAIEHFESDLLFFQHIYTYIKNTSKNILQIHLFPSAACLTLYLFHGLRQYTPRTVSKIVSIFTQINSHSILFKLGGPTCNKLHFQFITKPFLTERKDYREIKAEEYKAKSIKAVLKDLKSDNNTPSFYALIIHSNFNEKLF